MRNLTPQDRQHIPSRQTALGIIFVLIVMILVALLAPHVADAQPTGYQEYYVLGYEKHIWRAFLAINDAEPDPPGILDGKICSTVGLVATANYQIIYYDHWEDGYEADLLNPIQSTTEIYGDGDPSNGGTGNDILRAGDVVNLTSDQPITGTLSVTGYVSVVPSRNPAEIRYDGGDRVISSGGPIDLTHAVWPLDNSWVGGAWEIYSRQAYFNTYSYRLPIGEDLYTFGGGDQGSYGDFRDVYLQLGAFEDNTVVLIDNGADVINLTLNQGQTYSSMGYINSTVAPAIDIKVSTEIRSSKPVQAGLVTGADGTFQGRFMIVLPDRLWGADYVVPVPRSDTGPALRAVPAELYLSNPNDFPITINAYDALTQTTFVISPSAHISSTVPYPQKRGALGYAPQDSAVRLTSSEGVFGVLVSADTSRDAYDWGFSAVPAKYLTQDYYVSWAPGSTDLSSNGSPIWVTPLSDNTTFYVDFSPLDGNADEIFVLDVLEQRRIFDPDNDNTGTHVWATAKFAIVWGEDPGTANVAEPYLDLGVATLPLLQRWLDPVLTIDKTASPTILPPSGGTVTFTLDVQGFDAYLTDLEITDTLPLNWAYVPDSTHVNGAPWDKEPTQNGQILNWDLSVNLELTQSLTLLFQAQITDTAGITTSVNKANAVGKDQYSASLFSPTDQAIVYLSDLNLVKSVSQEQAGIGETLVYTLAYTNTSLTTTVTNVSIYDTVPIQHVTFKAASNGGVYAPASGTVSWTLGTLTPGASGQVTFSATINNFVQDGTTIENIGYIQSDHIHAGSNVACTTVRAPDVHLYKSGPSVTLQGETITYTLAYQNVGGSQASGVVISDHIPLFTQYLPGSLSINTGNGWEPLSDGIGDDQGAFISPTLAIRPGVTPGQIAPGEMGQIRFSVQIDTDPPAGSLILNTAIVDRDLDIPRNSNTVVTHIAALFFSKSAKQTIVTPGDVISFTLTYENASETMPYTNVYVQEPIPDYTCLLPGTVQGGDQVEYSWDNGQSWSPTLPVTPVTTIRWYDEQVLIGDQASLSFAVQVDAILPPNTTIHNVATFSSTETAIYAPAGITSNSVAVETVDLSLEKAASRSTAQPGETVSFTLSYRNRGSADALGVQIIDTLSGEMTYVPGSIWGSGADEGQYPPRLIWNVPIVASSSAPQQVGYAVVLNQDLPPRAVITNSATLSNTYGVVESETVTVTITIPDISVTPLALAVTLDAGETSTRALTIQNLGNLDLNWTLTEWIDAPWLDQAPTAGSTAPLSSTGVTLTFDTAGLTSDTYTSTLQVSSNDPDTPQWNVPVTLTVLAPNIILTPQALSVALPPGQVTTRTLTVSNTGNADLDWTLTEQVVVDWLTQTPATSIVGPLGSADVQVTFDSLDLAAGVYTSTLQVDSNDPDTPRIDVPVTLTIGQPSLSLSKTAHHDLVAPGERLTYTLHITNDGLPARDLIVSDVLPNDTTFAGCGGATCRLESMAVIWGPLDLSGPGETLGLTMVVTVSAALTHGWPIVNATYGLDANNVPPLAGKPLTTTVSLPILHLTKWTFLEEVYAGSRLNYTLLMQNSGGRATHLVVSDTLPSGTAFVGCNCSLTRLHDTTAGRENGFCGTPFTCGLEGEQVVWRLDEVIGGRAVQLTLWTTVSAGLADGALIVNDDYVAIADGLSPLIGRPPVTSTVRQLMLDVHKSAWPNPVALDEQLAFTITVRNGGVLLQNVIVTDLLPNDVSFVNCDGTLCEMAKDGTPEIRWWLGDLPPNSEREVSVRVTLENVHSDTLINASYGAWIPEVGRLVQGEPVVVRVLARYIHLPIVLVDF